jgi:hypothetical protein
LTTDRLAVLPVHIVEEPSVRVQFQPAREVADRERQLGPGDFAPLAQVNLRIDGDEAFWAADHRVPEDPRVRLDRTAGVELVNHFSHVWL